MTNVFCEFSSTSTVLFSSGDGMVGRLRVTGGMYDRSVYGTRNKLGPGQGLVNNQVNNCFLHPFAWTDIVAIEAA